MTAVVVFTAAEASRVARCQRPIVDGAAATGALKAADLTPDSKKRSWRIRAADLDDWIARGYPRTP